MAHKDKPELKDVITPSSPDPIYTLERAATVLDCSTVVLARKFKAGEIQGKKKLGKWFTCHSNLLAYINA
jgi:hypothetical protein